MRQKGRMEMNAMFSLLSFLYFVYISACFTPQTKGIRKYQIARYNVVQTCIQYSTLKTLIFERKCHSVADLREGAVAGFQSKKDKFLWVKGRRGIGDCVFFFTAFMHFTFIVNFV